MAVTQFSVVLKNTPGTLATISSRLGYSGINVRGISLTKKYDYSILRLIVNDPVGAERTFREIGITYSIETVIIVEMPNVPGALSQCVKILGGEGINIEYIYPLIARTANALLVIKTDSGRKAEEALLAQGNIILQEQDLLSLE